MNGDTGPVEDVRSLILGRLAELEKEHRVRILLAVESGSRAWGFPSPDSDWDVRFIYARAPLDYLTLHPQRDVIEAPFEQDLDISGWDLVKALRLMLKSNAVVWEWIKSPTIYREDAAAVAALAGFAERTSEPERVRWHYLNLAIRAQSQSLTGRRAVNLKKYFYVLRPALALRHIRLHRVLPPMALPELIASTELPEMLRTEIEALVSLKARTREMGTAAPIPIFDDLIASELAQAQHPPGAPAGPRPDLRAEADRVFHEILGVSGCTIEPRPR